MVFEAVAGQEAFLAWKNSSSPVKHRQLLLVQWIFRQGVFDSEFPLTRRFLSDEDYENDEEEEEEE